jgi:dienelactone hydrolase
MNLSLWIIAGLLAAIFLAGGVGKLILRKEKIAATPLGGWVEDFSADSIKTIGALEILAVYPHAGHGFLNDPAPGETPRWALVAGRFANTGYHDPSAQHARRRILAFFQEHLTS